MTNWLARNSLVLTLVAAGATLCAVIWLVGSTLIQTRELEAAVSIRVDEVLAAINQNETGRVYDQMACAEMRRVVRREEFGQFANRIRARLGTLRIKSLEQLPFDSSIPRAS